MEIKKEMLISYLIILLLTTAATTVLANPDPSGATASPLKTERSIADVANSHPAFAGNVTEIDIYGESISITWQGYFGNVSGVVTLDDAANHSLYNWTLASPDGEVYAANGTVTWTNVQCFNFTATGFENVSAEQSIYTDDANQRGATNLYGKNLSMLESEFSIDEDDIDGVNETFKNGTVCEGCLAGGWNNESHDLFYVGTLQFDAGECLYTRVFGNTGEGVDDQFEEVLLWDPDGNNTIFTSLLEDDMVGFDATPKDFEMVVLENGHNGNIDPTDYWFYIEIE